MECVATSKLYCAACHELKPVRFETKYSCEVCGSDGPCGDPGLPLEALRAHLRASIVEKRHAVLSVRRCYFLAQMQGRKLDEWRGFVSKLLVPGARAYFHCTKAGAPERSTLAGTICFSYEIDEVIVHSPHKLLPHGRKRRVQYTFKPGSLVMFGTPLPYRGHQGIRPVAADRLDDLADALTEAAYPLACD